MIGVPMQVNCPKCSKSNDVDSTTADSSGKVRLTCWNCGSRVLLKVNPKALRLSPDIPSTPSEAPEPPPRPPRVAARSLPPRPAERPPPEPEPPRPPRPAGPMIRVKWLDPKKLAWFRKDLLELPRFARRPALVDTTLKGLPYELTGITKKEIDFLEGRLRRLVADFETITEEPPPPPFPSDNSLDGERFDSGEIDEPPTHSINEITFDRPAGAVGGRRARRRPTDSLEYPTGRSSGGIVAQAGRELPLFTVPTHRNLREHLGAVQVTVIVPARELDPPQAAVDSALARARARLQAAAAELEASAVVGLRTHTSMLPVGDHGRALLVVMEGTAVRF